MRRPGIALVATIIIAAPAVHAASIGIISTPGGTVVVGMGTMMDTATLSGGFNPTGTITFSLFAAGGFVVDTETVTVSGNGTYTTPTGYIPISVGTCQWMATYSGDANNGPGSTGPGDEPETVDPASPSLTTTPGGPVTLGTSGNMVDTAVLSGGFEPGGIITFTLLSPVDLTVDTETVSVAGNGSYSTPVGYLPASAGTYEWIATYGGDSNNNAFATGDGSEPESANSAAPEPASMALMCVAGAALVLRRLRRYRGR